MAILNNNTLAGSSGQGGAYTIDNSLRFRSSASAYLSRTNSSSPTNAKIGSLSMWVKRGSLATGNSQYLMETGTGASNNTYFTLFFTTSNTISAGQYSETPFTNTSVLFRDTAAWYHIFIAYDSTQGTAADRFKLYVNNELLTSSSTISLNNEWAVLQASQALNFGRHTSVGRHFDGYLTEINLIDGQTLSPTDFGEYDEDTGAWKAKEYTGTYGNNGFYLKFDDTSSVAALGTDSSGNGNDFTPTNISLTAGTTYDSMKDVPILTDEDTANFATLNPLDNNGVALTEGNLTGVIAVNENVSATIAPTSGKWYWEVYVVDNTNPYIGIKKTESNTTGYTGEAVGINNAGDIYFNASNQSKDGLPGFSNTDIVGVAWDADAQLVWWSKNGQWYTADAAGESAIASSEVAAGNNGYDYSSQITNAKPYVGSSASNGSVTLNFGQRPFSYTPPTGYKKLNTYNLPDSTIVDGSQYMNVKLWTGNGTNQDIDVGWNPDLVWYRNRTDASGGVVTDSIRGDDLHLQTTNTNAEGAFANMEFITNGYNVSGNVNLDNISGRAFVGWHWKANGAGVSNGDGSVTSTVSANTTAGFSIATYTEPSSGTYTVGHGLGVVPSMIILKPRNIAGENWIVYHTSLGAAPTNTGVYLNTTSAAFATGSNWLTENTTARFGVTVGQVTPGSGTMVAYCFAEVEGYSKFGSYTGNGNADGPFIYTGFRPAFVMIKRSNTTGSWYTFDNKREGYNVDNDTLLADTTAAETTTDYLDLVSNSFKCRTTAAAVNTSASTYIYMAFAENPFKNSTAR
jgi:hypothetical protein